MDISAYRAGKFTTQFGYKTFHPEFINKEWSINHPELTTLLEAANIKLGQLNAFSMFAPNMDVFLRMHIVKEATQSSRIEGTLTGMDEALLNKRDVEPEKENDWQEVQNYIKALGQATEQLSGSRKNKPKTHGKNG